MFVIPWLGRKCIGTTDADSEGDLPSFKLRQTRRSIFKRQYSYTVRAEGNESWVLRKHRIPTPTKGLISVLGGTITGYRAIAEEVTDFLANALKVNEGCQTAHLALPIPPELELGEQIAYSVENEHCRTLNDFMFRRTTLGFSPDQGRSRIIETAEGLGRALKWTGLQRSAELEKYFAFARRSESFSVGEATVRLVQH